MASGLVEVDGKVRADHHASEWHAVAQQADGDRVLLTTKESFGAVDWVDGPGELVGESCGGRVARSGRACVVDPIANLFEISGSGAGSGSRVCAVIADYVVDQLDNLGRAVFASRFAKMLTTFFSNDRVRREGVGDGAQNDCLAAVVGDGDW